MRPRAIIRAAGATVLILAAACGSPDAEDRQAAREAVERLPADSVHPPVPAGGGGTRALMRNVHFHLPHDVILRIAYVAGEMRPLEKGQPIILDDPASFVMRVDAGEIALSMGSLERLMNDFVFAYDDAPLRDFTFETVDDRVLMKGKLDAIVDIGFEVEATPEMTPTGEILMRPHRIRTAGAIGTAIRNLLSLQLDEVVDFSGARGVRAEGDHLFLDPSELMPPPRIEGPITEIRVENGFLVQRFGNADDNRAARADIERRLQPGSNEMLFTGGQLGFGKLRMIDTDMRVIDRDKDDPFDFSIVRYMEQLVAGYSRTMPDAGLNVHMPDLNDISGDSTAASSFPAQPPEGS